MPFINPSDKHSISSDFRRENDAQSINELDEIQKFKEFFDFVPEENVNRLLVTESDRGKSLLIVHGDGFLKSTPFEGASSRIQTEQVLSFLRTLNDPESITFPLNHIFPSDVFEKLYVMLEGALKIEESKSHGAAALSDAIYTQMNLHGRAYLFLSYAGKSGVPGHIFGVYIEKTREGKLICYLMNRGEGNYMHEPAEIETHPKISPTFPPIILHDSDFFCREKPSELTLHFLNKILMFDEVLKQADKPYSSVELYELFVLLGEIQRNVIPPFRPVTSQRSGTCGEQVVRLVAQCEIERGVSNPEESFCLYKNYIFAYKAFTLFILGRKFTQENLGIELFLKEAAAHFAMAARKMSDQGLITPKGYLYSIALCEWFQGKIPVLSPRMEVQGYPELFRCAPKLIKQKKGEKVKESDEELNKASSKTKVSTSPECVRFDYFTTINPEEFSTAIESICESLYESCSEKLHIFIEQLPLPDIGRNEFWHRIPEEDLDTIFLGLEMITGALGVALIEDGDNHTYLFLSLLKVLAITDKLACQRYPEQMKDYSLFLDFNSMNPNIFPVNGKDVVLFAKLREYFETRIDTSKKRLFNFVGEFDIQKKIEEWQGGSLEWIPQKDYDLFHHLKFLESFDIGSWQIELNKLSYPAQCKVLFSGDFQIIHSEDPLAKRGIKGYLLKKEHTSSNIKQLIELNEKIEKYNDDVVRRARYEKMAGITKRYVFDLRKMIKDQRLFPFFYYGLECGYGIARRLLHDNLPSDFEFMDLKGTQFSFNVAASDEAKQKSSQKVGYKGINVEVLRKNECENNLLLEEPILIEEFPYSLDDHRQLQLAANNEDLRIVSVIDYLEEYPGQALNPKVFVLIERLLLDNFVLINTVRHEPAVAGSLRRVLDKCIARARNSWTEDADTLLNWLLLSYHVETHLMETAARVDVETRVQKLDQEVNTLLQELNDLNTKKSLKIATKLRKLQVYLFQNERFPDKHILLNLIYLSIYPKTKTDQYIDPSIKNLVLSIYSPKTKIDQYIDPSIKRMMFRWQNEITGSRKLPYGISTPEELIEVIPPSFIPGRKVEKAFEENGEGRPGVVLDDGTEYSFDFSNFSLYRNGLLVKMKINRKEREIDIAEDGFYIESLDDFIEVFVNENHTDLISPDGLLTIEFVKDKINYIHRFSGLEGDYKLKDNFLMVHGLDGEYEYLQWKKRGVSQAEVVITKGNDYKAFALYRDGRLLRTTSEGRVLEPQEVLLEADSSYPLSVHLWGSYNPVAKRWEPTQIEFYHQSNEFRFRALKQEGRIMFQSVEWNEYCLSEIQSPLTLNHFNQFLLLERIDDFDTKLLIVPYQNLGQWSAPKSLKTDINSDGFYIFKVNTKQGDWKATTSEAYLFLIYAFILHGNFKEAQKALDNLSELPKKYHLGSEIKIVELKTIFEQKGNHPSILALQLRLCLFIQDQLMNQRSKKISQGYDDFLIKENLLRRLELLEKGMNYWINYIQVQSNPILGHFPEELKLTLAEEKRLIRYFQKEINELSDLKPFNRDRRKEDYEKQLKEISGKYNCNSASIARQRIFEPVANRILDFEVSLLQYPSELKEVWGYRNKKNPHTEILDDYVLEFFTNEIRPRNRRELLGKLFLQQTFSKDNNVLTQFDIDLHLLKRNFPQAHIVSRTCTSIAWLMRNFPEHFSELNFCDFDDENFLKRAAVLADELINQPNFVKKVANVLTGPNISLVYEMRFKQSESHLTLEQQAPFHPKRLTIEKYPEDYQPRFNGLGNVEAVKNEIDHLENEIQQINESIQKVLHLPSQEEIMKWPPERRKVALNYMNELQSGQRSAVTLKSHLISYVMKRDPELLKKWHPLLTDQQCSELYRLTIDYLIKKTSQNWLQKCLRESKSVVEVRRHFNPYEHPELMVYEYLSGMILRENPNQAEILIQVFDKLFNQGRGEIDREALRHLFFEFQAGGGKTKVISVIIALRAILEGKQPIFFTLPDIHDITYDDLKQTLEIFGIKTKEIIITQGTELNAVMLKSIYKMLKRSHENGELIVSHPETYHSLHLDYQDALDKAEMDKIKYHTKIDSFFRNQALFLIDEAHRNEDSLLQANKAIGVPEGLPSDQNEFLIHLFRYLFGFEEIKLRLEDGRDIASILKLRENKQATVSTTDLEKIRELLANWMVEYLKIPQEWKAFLLDSKEQAPKDLLRMNRNVGIERNRAQCIFFARGILNAIFSHVMGQVGRMDYRVGQDGVAIPCYQRTPSGAKYESSDVAAALTLQALFQKGISKKDQILNFILLLQETMKKQRDAFIECEITEIEMKFLEWQEGDLSPVQLASLDQGKLENQKLLKKLARSIGRHPDAIEWFYRECVAEKILVFPQKMISTAADFVNNSWATLHFSATLGHQSQYPYFEGDDRFLPDVQFVNQVMQRALQEENAETIWMQETTPYDLFENLFNSNSSIFNSLQGIINVGGWSKYSSNKQWALQFLKFAKTKNLPFEGVVYAQETINEETNRPTKHLYLLRQGETEPIVIKGSNLNEEIKILGIKNEAIFKIYGPAETTGTDLTMANNRSMALLLGENLRISTLVQAIMRMRGFLLSEQEQKLIWIGSEGIAPLIDVCAGDTMPSKIFNWAQKNEEEYQKKAIVARAYQEIEYVVHNIIKEDIRCCSKDYNRQVDLFKEHREAFIYELGRDTYALYGQSNFLKSTQIVLRSYLDVLLKKAGLNLKKYPKAQKRVEVIIEETSRFVNMLESNSQRNLSARMQQQQRQVQRQETRQQVQQRQVNTVAGNFNPAPWKNYAQTSLRLDSNNLFSEKSPFFCKANHYFETDFFDENLYLTENILKSVKEKRTLIASEMGLKQIERLLIVEEGEQRRVFAVSKEDSDAYIKQLRNDESPSLTRRAALVSINGVIEQNGKGTLEIPELETVTQSNEFRMLLTQVNLINGKIRDYSRFRRLKEEHGRKIRAVWEKIKLVRITLPSLMNIDAIEQELKDYVPIIRTPSRPSLKNRVIKIMSKAIPTVAVIGMIAYATLFGWAWSAAILSGGLFAMICLFYTEKKFPLHTLTPDSRGDSRKIMG